MKIKKSSNIFITKEDFLQMKYTHEYCVRMETITCKVLL